MIHRHQYQDLLWVDVEKPTHDEVRGLMSEFAIHPVVADEILTPSLRARVDHYENFIYLVLHFPAIRHSHNGSIGQEVDFIIGKSFLITVRYEEIDPLHRFSKVFEVSSLIDKQGVGDHAGFLFFAMISKIYSSLGHELILISDTLKDIEQHIFHGEESQMVERLSISNRDILNFRQAMKLHRGVLSSLHSAVGEFFGEDFAHYIDHITGEYHKLDETLQDLKETIDDLRTTNDSLLASKTTQVIKTLTIINGSILPASLISWIFAMDTKHMPIIGTAYDFWIILSMMAFLSSLAYYFFRAKKWL